MEVVPNSSGEGSTCDEEISQEIPLQTGSEVYCDHPNPILYVIHIMLDMTHKATVNEEEIKNPSQCYEGVQRLSSVVQGQENLISYLNTLSEFTSSLTIVQCFLFIIVQFILSLTVKRCTHITASCFS